MGFAKQKQTADETFQADNIEDSLQGLIDFLDSNNISDKNDAPETIIVLRNNVQGQYGVRTFTGSIYVGKTIDEIKNDLQ